MRLKKYSGIVLIVLLTIISSCQRDEKRAIQRAELFLYSYFKVDLEKMSEFCLPSFGDELKLSLKTVDTLDDEVKEMIIKQTSDIKFEIKKVQKTKIKDSLVLTYQVLIPGYPADKDYRVSLVKRDKEWKVAALGI